MNGCAGHNVKVLISSKALATGDRSFTRVVLFQGSGIKIAADPKGKGIRVRKTF
jgi:hypothetical protein